MIDYDLGLLIFFSLLPTPEVRADSKCITQAEEDIEVKEIETEFKEEEEERLCSEDQLDIAKFKASNILEINGPEDEDEDLDPIQCTATFPTYTINEKDFVLLNDIQHLFDLREDYALAILAEWSENDKDFIDFQPCPFALLDTQVENFIDSASAGKHVLDIVTRYDKQGLPTEEEFQQIQKRLKIDHMGKDEIREPFDAKPTGSINIWDPILLEEDESPKVHLYFFFLF